MFYHWASYSSLSTAATPSPAWRWWHLYNRSWPQKLVVGLEYLGIPGSGTRPTARCCLFGIICYSGLSTVYTYFFLRMKAGKLQSAKEAGHTSKLTEITPWTKVSLSVVKDVGESDSKLWKDWRVNVIQGTVALREGWKISLEALKPYWDCWGAPRVIHQPKNFAPTTHTHTHIYIYISYISLSLSLPLCTHIKAMSDLWDLAEIADLGAPTLKAPYLGLSKALASL